MDRRDELASLPDHEIMARLKGAPEDLVMEGFEILVARHKNAIVSFLYRYVGDFRTAEDLAQETFLRVFRKIGDYNNSARFSTWLYTIASNLAKDEFKRRARHPARSLDGAGARNDTTRPVPEVRADTTESVPDVRLQHDEARQAVRRALELLEEQDREILLLKDVQGLSYEEIAHVLNVPLGTVKSRLSRARLAFKEVWKKIGA
ncbi:MAG TPA: sigma-70 family RNA polymerase sigma factor [Planctomycetota bacterium]|jgi:RNA polymerase sigma-70 factor (ECF subfamily)|nr:sigma-70 family RNA polymerase sigma factor [Planctomycetota bacterium]